jgi:hypothetical protein
MSAGPRPPVRACRLSTPCVRQRSVAVSFILIVAVGLETVLNILSKRVVNCRCTHACMHADRHEI